MEYAENPMKSRQKTYNIMVLSKIHITYLPIKGGSSLYSKDLISVFKSRINTQRRNGNLSGGICFIPSLIRQILKKFGNKTFYDQWLEKTLDSVYFELDSGKIVPLRFVEHLYLKETATKSILPSSGSSLSGIAPIAYTPTTSSSVSWYEVYVDYKENCQTYTNERVYLGDDLNLARGGIEDVTLDHVVPIRDVLTDFADQLPYLKAISYIVQNIKPSSYTNVKNYIINDISTHLVNELNLIVQKTRGIRICSGRVN